MMRINKFLIVLLCLFICFISCNTKTSEPIIVDQISLETEYPEGTPEFEPDPEPEPEPDPEPDSEPEPEEPKSEKPTPETPKFVQKMEDCPDLVIDNIEIRRRKNKHAIINVFIKNIGDTPAKMVGDSKEEYDNVQIMVYVSGTTEFSRGDVKVGQYILGLEDGIRNLEPGEMRKVALKVPTVRISQYTKVFIFQLDSYNAMKECDNSNNYESFVY